MKPHIAIAALLAWSLAASAQEAFRTPLPTKHPLVGVWRIDFPDKKCFEEYDIRANGTKLSQSAEERNESEVQIALVPSSKGFYKWTDKTTRTNGKPDCNGSTSKAGSVAVIYAKVHQDGQRFALCEAEDLTKCFAEFHRK